MEKPQSSPQPDAYAVWAQRLRSAWREAGRLLRRYADWLAAQSWKRVALLAVAAVALTGILSSIPPFSTRWGESRTVINVPTPPRLPRSRHSSKPNEVELQIDKDGIRVRPHLPGPPAPASGASAPDVTVIPLPPNAPVPDINIKLPPEADREDVRQAIEDAKEQLRSAAEEWKSAAEDAKAAAEEARTEVVTSRGFRLGDHMVSAMLLVIVASIIAKVMGTGRKKAEAQAAVATERAESESLKRQVVEARMAAMQAQVEPHFLFNTLASIDHLIETDPARASQMQRNLIALLRASMPTMRDTANAGPRPLERELALVKPYLEILKVRMEERLQVEIEVPEGLLSAEFPPMMVQGLVENAIKHGLEPKAEGGKLTVRAEVRHGKLAVTVADTGLGFGKAATSGTGVGLANIRERLQLLYGSKASVTVTENQPSGTVVTITVPYTHHDQEGAAS